MRSPRLLEASLKPTFGDAEMGDSSSRLQGTALDAMDVSGLAARDKVGKLETQENSTTNDLKLHYTADLFDNFDDLIGTKFDTLLHVCH